MNHPDVACLQHHTPEEAAAVLRCSPTWLEREARAGRIPSRKIGGARVFAPADLAAISEMHRQGHERHHLAAVDRPNPVPSRAKSRRAS